MAVAMVPTMAVTSRVTGALGGVATEALPLTHDRYTK